MCLFVITLKEVILSQVTSMMKGMLAGLVESGGASFAWPISFLFLGSLQWDRSLPGFGICTRNHKQFCISACQPWEKQENIQTDAWCL